MGRLHEADAAQIQTSFSWCDPYVEDLRDAPGGHQGKTNLAHLDWDALTLAYAL